MDDEEDVYKRDITGATLEDRFDKTVRPAAGRSLDPNPSLQVLPKVMQVKNFGRSSRTKYTHLVDQDTTSFDAAWSQESASNAKFTNQHAGGMRQVFVRPAAKKT
jgi:microfibrillar-associated protein 1